MLPVGAWRSMAGCPAKPMLDVAARGAKFSRRCTAHSLVAQAWDRSAQGATSADPDECGLQATGVPHDGQRVDGLTAHATTSREHARQQVQNTPEAATSGNWDGTQQASTEQVTSAAPTVWRTPCTSNVACRELQASQAVCDTSIRLDAAHLPHPPAESASPRNRAMQALF